MRKLTFILMFLIAACSSKLMVPTVDIKQMQNRVPSITIETANKGYKLYVHYCASCHHLHEPGKYTENEWSSILTKMLRKAKVKDSTDRQLITDYLRSLSK